MYVTNYRICVDVNTPMIWNDSNEGYEFLIVATSGKIKVII
jgi:hypothetical protein